MARSRSISKWDWLLILGIFAAISLTEYVFAYLDVRIGIVMALFTALVIYFVISVKEMRAQVVDSAECLALVPIYILLTSSLPWFFIHQAYLLPAVYATIIGLCFYYVYEKRLSFEELGFKKDKFLKYALLGVIIGVPFGTIEYFLLTPAPAYPTFEFVHLLTDAIYMLFFVALGEELLFRALIPAEPLFRIRHNDWACICKFHVRRDAPHMAFGSGTLLRVLRRYGAWLSIL